MAFANFEEWKYEVDRQFRIRTQCTWDDLCGEDQRLKKAYHRNETPHEFVVWWIEHYNLSVTKNSRYYG